MLETYEKYVRGSNPIKYFVEKALTTVDAAGNKIPKDIMYDSYRYFCHVKKIAPESEQSFSRKLTKEFGFKAEQFRRKDGERLWCWVGVNIVKWKAVEDSEQQTLAEFTDEERKELR
jgi:hypothetical protein